MPYTLVEPRAVMVHFHDESLAHGTVLSKLSESDLIFEYVKFTESERGYVYNAICELSTGVLDNEISKSIFSKKRESNINTFEGSLGNFEDV